MENFEPRYRSITITDALSRTYIVNKGIWKGDAVSFGPNLKDSVRTEQNLMSARSTSLLVESHETVIIQVRQDTESPNFWVLIDI